MGLFRCQRNLVAAPRAVLRVAFLFGVLTLFLNEFMPWNWGRDSRAAELKQAISEAKEVYDHLDQFVGLDRSRPETVNIRLWWYGRVHIEYLFPCLRFDEVRALVLRYCAARGWHAYYRDNYLFITVPARAVEKKPEPVPSSPFTQIRHHGNMVWTWADKVGINRSICLCYKCGSFKPNEREKNCPIAEAVYKNCLVHGITSPVTECPAFVDAKALEQTKKEVTS